MNKIKIYRSFLIEEIAQGLLKYTSRHSIYVKLTADENDYKLKAITRSEGAKAYEAARLFVDGFEAGLGSTNLKIVVLDI